MRAARPVLIFVAAAVGVLFGLWLLDARAGTSVVESEVLGTLYNPVRSGEPTPKNFRQLLPRDAILPIYDPEFVPAPDVDWHDKSLVIGLTIDGDARAYPVSFLNRREIVNDHVGKTPVLVTW